MVMDENVLSELGLSPNESKVYLALLSVGSTAVADIASKVDIHRVNIYDALRRLREKGLVASITKGDRTYYEPASPIQLGEIIRQKKEQLDKISSSIPKLLDVFNQEKSKQNVHHYFGKKGLVSIYDHLLEIVPENEEFLSLGATGTMREYLDFYMGQFERKRKAKNLIPRVLYYHKLREVKKFEKMNVRYIPEGIEFMPMTVYIYGGWVAIISFEAMLGIEIQSYSIANGFRKYFEWLWSISKE